MHYSKHLVYITQLIFTIQGWHYYFFILQVRKPRHRGAKQHAQDKMINQWHDHNSNNVQESAWGPFLKTNAIPVLPMIGRADIV